MGTTMVLWKELWYYTDNYGIIPKTVALQFTKQKTWLITKNYETLIYNEKQLFQNTKTIEVFEQIYSFRTLTYYGKTMVLKIIVLWEKLLYYRNSYDTIPIYGTLIYYGKNYGIMEKKLWYCSKVQFTIACFVRVIVNITS